MKPKLTKAMKAKVKRAVVRELRETSRLWFDDESAATVAEARRLLKVALRAVKGA